MARAEAHLVGYMLAIYIDAAHSYGVAGEGQCSGKALGRPYSMEQTFHQIWYGHAHGAFACLASSLVIPSYAIKPGHTILKGLFGVLEFSQKTNERIHRSSKNEFVCSFFGRI